MAMEDPARTGSVVALCTPARDRAPPPALDSWRWRRAARRLRPGSSAGGRDAEPLHRAALVIGLVVAWAVFLAPRPASAQIYLTQWGSYGSGNGEFPSAVGIAIDPSGNVYVADPVAHRVQKFSASGGYLTQWGSLGTGGIQFGAGSPMGIAIDAAGNVFVSDPGNSRIKKSRRPAAT